MSGVGFHVSGLELLCPDSDTAPIALGIIIRSAGRLDVLRGSSFGVQSGTFLNPERHGIHERVGILWGNVVNCFVNMFSLLFNRFCGERFSTVSSSCSICVSGFPRLDHGVFIC